MSIRKVYKKENLCRSFDSCTDNTATKIICDIIIVDDKYFCKIQGSRVIQATRIHWKTSGTAIDLDGHKYTFADSCFMISPVGRTVTDERIIVEDNYDPFNVPVAWTTQDLWYKDQYINFGRPLYSLCPGSWITILESGSNASNVRTMVLETIVQDDSVVIETDTNTILVTGSSFSIIDRRT